MLMKMVKIRKLFVKNNDDYIHMTYISTSLKLVKRFIETTTNAKVNAAQTNEIEYY